MAMPATGAVEELAMLAIILLVLRLAMPATGQLRTLLWDLALSASLFLQLALAWHTLGLC